MFDDLGFVAGELVGVGEALDPGEFAFVEHAKEDVDQESFAVDFNDGHDEAEAFPGAEGIDWVVDGEGAGGAVVFHQVRLSDGVALFGGDAGDGVIRRMN